MNRRPWPALHGATLKEASSRTSRDHVPKARFPQTDGHGLAHRFVVFDDNYTH